MTKRRHIAICTPCGSGNVNLRFATSLMDTIKSIHQTDITFLTIVGSSVLHAARNSLVAMAMARGCDQIVFIDDDVSWTSAGFERLILHPASIVAGVYQKKLHHPRGEAVMAISALPTGVKPDANGLVEVDACATGFLRIDRGVFEAMKASSIKLEDEALNPHENAHLHRWFEFGVMEKDGKHYEHGEDYHFCSKARSAGFKSYIDPDIKLGHHHGQFKFDASMNKIDLL
jgi:hypothetical protein